MWVVMKLALIRTIVLAHVPSQEMCKFGSESSKLLALLLVVYNLASQRREVGSWANTQVYQRQSRAKWRHPAAA